MKQENTRIYRIPFVQSYALRKFFEKSEGKENSPFLKQDPLFKTLAHNDGKTLPLCHEFTGGMYLVYSDVKEGETLPLDKSLDLGELEKARKSEDSFLEMFGGKRNNFTDQVEFITEVPNDEFIWMEQYDTAIKSRTTPPEPPEELEHLFSKNTFRANGKSFDALEHLIQQERWRRNAEKQLEKRLFGEPEIKDTFNVNGHIFSTVDSKFHPVFDQGTAIGIRCNWEPLHPHYTGMKNIEPPEGWHEISEQPGVYAPDPVTNQQDCEILAKLSWPDYKSQKDVFGHNPIITSQEHKDAYPRTYQNWPSVDALQDKQGAFYYIFVPTDYKGDTFRPVGSIRITEFENRLFGNSTGDMYEPHIQFRPEGVAYPADFTFTPPPEEPDIRYFRPAGRSKKILEEFEAERKNVSKMRRDFIKAVGGNGNFGYRGNEITNVSFNSKVPEGWKSERQSRHTERDDEGEYKEVPCFECTPDKRTKTGKKLAQEMKSFPKEPDFKDLQNRWTPEAPHMPHPQWSYDGDSENKIFYYDTAEIEGEFAPPPEATELPTAAYKWYSQNRTDINCGIEIPPMPDALKKQVDDLIEKKQKNGPSAPTPQ